MSFNMYMPTRIIFGNGCLNEFHTLKMPGNKAMLVIFNGKSLKELDLAKIETVVFDKINANPTKTVVMEGDEFA